MKLYLLKWGNGMIGGFLGKDLNQTFNTSEETLFFSIEHTMELYKVKSLEIEIINSHEELNKMRQDMGLNTKNVL